jgi:magnesium transporter
MTEARPESDQTGAVPAVTEAGSTAAELLESVESALERGDVAEVAALVEPEHPADLADLVESVDPELRSALVDAIQSDVTGEVLAEMDETVRGEVVDMLGAARTAEAVSDLDTDDAVAVIEELDADVAQEVLQELEPEDRREIEQALAYPEDSAGRLMQRELIAVEADWDVGEVIDHCRDSADLPDNFYELIVVDGDRRPIGTVALDRLLRTKRPVSVRDIMDADPTLIPVDMDQEDVALLFQRYNHASAPVVDGQGRLAGVIMHDDVADVITEEAEEDILALSGVQESDVNAGPFETVRQRLRWLIVTLVNTILAAIVISQFQDTIETLVAVAVLMPIVAAMGGNSGMQTVTVTVRALAMREITRANVRRALWREVIVGLIHGAIFATVMGGIAGLWFANPRLGFVLAGAMLVNMVWAGLAGAAIPLVLKRLGFDPAIASGPFLTTTTDVLGFFLFLGLATLFLV